MVRSRVHRKILGVIPARYASSRFPGKALAKVDLRTMLEHVHERVSMARYLTSVIVATDDRRIADEARRFGARVKMTREDHVSGTDRVAEVASAFEDFELVVNIQGDEPTLSPDFFPPLLDLFGRPEVEVSTLAVRCPPEEFTNPNAVKVVTALDGRALYFSRATIPFDRDGIGFAGYRKHLGIYAYRKAALERFAALPPSPLEKLERLEQLRLLENEIDIYVADAPRDTIGVDTEEDLARAEAMLKDDASRSGT